MAADIHDIRDAGMFNREEAYGTLREEMGSLLTSRNYARDFDVQDHKNEEAVAQAELAVLMFRVNRYSECGSLKSKHVDKVVAAVTKATIATARRMKREEELSRFEQEIKDLKRKADKAGIEFPPDWEV